MQLTFEGETLPDIIFKIRRFLESLPGDAAQQGLVNLDEPLPPAVKRASRQREDEPTEGQIKAAKAAQAPPKDPFDNLFG